MPLNIIVGAQWGDEGKGRVTDLLAAEAHITARYSGGDNAGHTVTVGGSVFKLHLLPSGIVQPHAVAVIGNGLVVNPARLLEEMDGLAGNGIDISPARLMVSHAAHVITPSHMALDRAEEARRAGGKIGTTGRGIGPAYTDKTARRGIRMEAMRDPGAYAERVRAQVAAANRVLETEFGAAPLDADAVAAEHAGHAARLKDYIRETSLYLDQALRAGKTVLAEGAQGTLLDLDHGTYPYVTSSNPIAGGACIGLGVGPRHTGRVIGVVKAFQTRVGEGPFPTEVFGDVAERLRGTGANPWDEFGTTTGRPRRCGWLDTVLLRYAARVNGLSELVLTKLDVLTGLPNVRVCAAYEWNRERTAELPLGPTDLSPFTPVYEDLPGWPEDVSRFRRFDDLPSAAREYVRRAEALSGVPVRMISVGPEREQVIRLD